MDADLSTLHVECETGLQGEQTPRRFYMGDKAIEILDIIDRWLASGYDYFKVRDSGNDVYILRHDKPAHRWELIMFRSGKYHSDVSL